MVTLKRIGRAFKAKDSILESVLFDANGFSLIFALAAAQMKDPDIKYFIGSGIAFLATSAGYCTSKLCREYSRWPDGEGL